MQNVSDLNPVRQAKLKSLSDDSVVTGIIIRNMKNKDQKENKLHISNAMPIW